MFNFLKSNKKDATVKENYKSVNNVVKAHYEEFLANNGINDSIKRAGISFPENLYEFLKVFSKYEGMWKNCWSGGVRRVNKINKINIENEDFNKLVKVKVPIWLYKNIVKVCNRLDLKSLDEMMDLG